MPALGRPTPTNQMSFDASGSLAGAAIGLLTTGSRDKEWEVDPGDARRPATRPPRLCPGRARSDRSLACRQVEILLRRLGGDAGWQRAPIVPGHAVLPFQEIGDALGLDAELHAHQAGQQQ